MHSTGNVTAGTALRAGVVFRDGRRGNPRVNVGKETRCQTTRGTKPSRTSNPKRTRLAPARPKGRTMARTLGRPVPTTALTPAKRALKHAASAASSPRGPLVRGSDPANQGPKRPTYQRLRAARAGPT